MQLESSRLKLIELSWDDLEEMHAFHLIPETDTYNTLGLPENIEVTREVIRPILEEKPDARSHYSWKVVEKGKNELIGNVGLILSNDKYKLGEIYYKFNPKYWGNGYATEVSKLLIETGFEVFKLHKVEAGVSTENKASINVLEKSGMTREGLRRKILPIRGEWKDNYHYAIVEDDPRP